MFTDSTVILTGVGGDGQLGEVVAQAFVDLGASLVLVDRRQEKVDARVAALAGSRYPAEGYACDLTDGESVAALVGKVVASRGKSARALVHMAGGFAMSGPVADSSVDVWNSQIAINLTTAFLTSRAFLPLIRAGRGSIVFVSSQVAVGPAPSPNMSAYAVAKTGVVVLMRAIATEERGNGVRVNAIAPSAIRTAANLGTMGQNARYVEREQVAAAITFLCSDAASAISGELVSLT